MCTKRHWLPGKKLMPPLEEKGNRGLGYVIRDSIEHAFRDFLFITQVLCVLTVFASCLPQQQNRVTSYLLSLIESTSSFRLFFRLKQLLSMYRVQFDHQDIILANATDPTTMTYFTSLLKLATSKGNSVYIIFY